VADDSVVVSKSRPEKPGNRVEDKTGMTCDRVYRGRYEPKAMDACEGRKFIRRFPRLMLREKLNTSHPTGWWGTLLAVNCDRPTAGIGRSTE
jgi:hypothetical protein